MAGHNYDTCTGVKMEILFGIMAACLFYWGTVLIIKSFVEEPSVTIARAQRLVSLVMYLVAAFALLYS